MPQRKRHKTILNSIYLRMKCFNKKIKLTIGDGMFINKYLLAKLKENRQIKL